MLFLASIADTGRRCSSRIQGQCAGDAKDDISRAGVSSDQPKFNGRIYCEAKGEQSRLGDEEAKAAERDPRFVAFSNEYFK